MGVRVFCDGNCSSGGNTKQDKRKAKGEGQTKIHKGRNKHETARKPVMHVLSGFSRGWEGCGLKQCQK